MQQLPRWAQELKDRHPGAAAPTRAEPIPDWLAEEARRMPLWYIIRGAEQARHEHPFLLYEEIRRQPDQWDEIVATYWPRVGELAATLRGKRIDQVIFTGCGSAFFSAIHGAYTWPRLTGTAASAVESHELTHYFPPVDPSTTLVVAHSGTGGSIETVEAVEEARRRGCTTLAVTNTDDTPVGRAADHMLTYVTHQRCGPCISVVSTRILLVTMLAVALAEGADGGDGDSARTAEAVRAELPRVGDVGRDFLARAEKSVRDLARDHAAVTSWLLVGSGPNYYSAREGTLKIEEQAICTGKAYRTGDFHHDALSQLAPERGVVAIEAAGAANDRVVDAVRAAREGRSPTVALTWSGGAGADELARHADSRLDLDPAVGELVAPVPMTVVFQLLGYFLGVERGYNPDTLRTDAEPNARAWLTSFPLGTH